MNTEKIMELAEKWKSAHVSNWDVSDSVEAYRNLESNIKALVQERDAHHREADRLREQVSELRTARDTYQTEANDYRIAADKLAAENKVLRDAWSAEPVAWLNPWRDDQVTTDYDAYGKHGIPLYTRSKS